MICYFFDEPLYFLFLPPTDVPALLYYSHIPVALVALLVGLFVYLNGRKRLLNKLLFIITVSFFFWTLSNLILWTNIHSEFLLFVWSFLRVFSSFISIFSIYFIYVFIDKHDISKRLKLIFLGLLSPVLVFAATNLNVSGFDITNCDAFVFEGPIYRIYHVSLAVLAMVWILFLLIQRYRKTSINFKKQIILMGAGIEFFLFSFFTMTFLGNYLTNLGILPDSRIEMYGMFGMGFFVVMMGVLIVRFKTFNVGMVAARALLISLIVLTASQLTFATSTTSVILTCITLVFTVIIGIQLIRSVNKEIKQREQLEVLTEKLEIANERLKELDKLKSEFVSIASHQLRSPLTAIRGYASLLTEGSYGKLPAKAASALERISESAKNMALSIEDYLSVSRIESGNMKYNVADFNLKDEAEKISDDLRPQAVKAGLGLIFRSDLKSKGVVNADIGKTIQIIQNLLNNSIKYTPEGSIRVLVRDDIVRKKIFVDIIDTGIGMDKKALNSVFGKFERAENANTVNIHGTGLGLFVAQKMAHAMEGDITAHSDGPGQGSRFTLEMPLVM